MLRLAEGPELYRPLWSDEIMAEVQRTLERQFGIAPNRTAHLESTLRRHFPEAWIYGFDSLIPLMTNDEKDRHVLAAAVHAQAPLLITYNLRHFPPDATAPWKVTAVGPGTFLKQLYASDPQSVVAVLHEQAADIKRTFATQLSVLHQAVPGFVDLVCRDTRTQI